MNNTEYIQYRSSFMNRLAGWFLFCGLLGGALLRPALAADSLYINNGILSYPGTTNHPPVIDATNFVNTGSFTINFSELTAGHPLYNTYDTANYTNTGTLVANTGFEFENVAATGSFVTNSVNFYNSGLISCGSSNDAYSFGSFLTGYSQFITSASNVVNLGTVDVGVGGIMQFTGQNINLNRGILLMEGGGANAFGIGYYGTNVWSPTFDLLSTNAYTPFFDLTNSVAYIETNSTDDGTNNIIRAVFIQDNSPANVSYGVYFDTSEIGFGIGNVTIQWAGTYEDVANDRILTNYLYLNDDYVLGASTNVTLLENGYPDNFTFTQSGVPLNLQVSPTPPGFSPIFGPEGLTNMFSYANVRFVSTTEFTNSNFGGIINGALTNFDGRILISASNELTMANVQIGGPNYLSVQSPHEFDGSANALIQSPYSDLNLGVTNGSPNSLTISNLLVPLVPIWTGTMQAWDTRWIVSQNGITNDYRVLVVGSDLGPTTLAQVQNMFLHTTNSVVISDSLNIMNTVNANAQNLTLTTNGPGNGATSLDGELNVNSPNIFWATSFPDLVNLTNNGAIRLQNLNQFIGSSNTVTIATNNTLEMPATNTLAEITDSANVSANDTVTIGVNQYTFVSQLANTVANEVAIAGTFDGSLNDLIAAINHAGGSGAAYSSATSVNPLATAGSLANHAFTVTARENGPAGNNVVSATTTSASLTWNNNGGFLAGGANAVAGTTTNTLSSSVPYDNFINSSYISDQGSTIWAGNFVNTGTITNGIGTFTLQSITATLTNDFLYAGGDISITADSLETSNMVLQSGRSLTLQATNLLTDDVPGGAGIVTNGNIWVVGGSSSVGLNLPVKPASGDLLGTTITNIASFNKGVINTWAGANYGVSASGFTNNAAIGRLILDAGTNGQFTFNGASTVPGVTNGLYVDYLELRDQATNLDSHGNPIALTNSANLIIYYAQAVMEGVSVAELLNRENNGHLRWVPAYAGHYSSTNLYYAGATNFINAALAQSPDIDSSGGGIPNADNSEPVFVSGQVNFNVIVTNTPPLKARITWNTIPDATNLVEYSTNLLSTNWITLTNFVTPSAPPYAPVANVLYDTLTNSTAQKYYRVRIDPNVTDLYGP